MCVVGDKAIWMAGLVDQSVLDKDLPTLACCGWSGCGGHRDLFVLGDKLF